MANNDNIKTNRGRGDCELSETTCAKKLGRTVLTLVRRARRRLFCNELLSQGANAFSAALVTFILLLLLGTQILDWRWVVAIPVTAAGVGLWLVLRRMPSAYRVAQIVDRRMHLADTLSTALFFAQDEPRRPGSAEVREFQRQQAERLAPGVDVRRAIPFTMPRAVYAVGALALVASSLFALRYGLTRRLDLKPPLARILQQTLGPNERTEMAKMRRNRQPDPRSVDQEDAEIEREIAAAQAEADREAQDAKQNPVDKAEGKQSNNAAVKQAEEGPKAETEDPEDGAEQRAAGQNPSQGKQSDGKGERQSASRQDSRNSTENSGLLSKMKDAMENLLSRMKPQPGGAGSQQQMAMNQNGKQAKSQQKSGQQAKDGQQRPGDQQNDSQEAQTGQESAQAQNSQGKGTGTSDAQQTSKQPGSGIGSQNGDKNIKQAEQLAAMGKLSQIFGKRSATITGQATVEVQSTSQQLQTPYARRSVEHAQTGEEISWDEIPAALQNYVEQYFEQVRKQAPKK